MLIHDYTALRTTLPLGSYIKKSLIVLYYASLVPIVKIFKKNVGGSEGLSFKGSDREKCQF